VNGIFIYSLLDEHAARTSDHTVSRAHDTNLRSSSTRTNSSSRMHSNLPIDSPSGSWFVLVAFAIRY
jgi:hypothetical protein